MVTTNQKPTVGKEKSKRNVPKYTTKENHQTTMVETKRRRNQQRTTTKNNWKKVIKWHKYIPTIITLCVNGLKAPTKRLRLDEWIQKQDAYICCRQETHFRPRETHRLKMRRWKKILHANGNEKRAGVAILISDNIDFKINTITRDKEGHNIIIKGEIQEEDITIVNIYAPKIGVPQYIRRMLTAIKREN